MIETSSQESFVALFKAEQPIDAIFLSDKNQSQELLPAIQQLLKRHHLTLSDLRFIAIGNGPGSFTGTRIGVMTAKALSFTQSIPLVPFCSLERFAPTCAGGFFEGHFAIVIDARSHGFYLARGKKDKEKIFFRTQPQLIKTKELFSLLTSDLQPTGAPFFASPHPDCIATKLNLNSQPVLNAALDLDSLGARCHAAFTQSNTCHHANLSISYLHIPT
ncbi:MAG: tRNA (adenosine(37)-N6)-threonylcarbamoyltransferase complex dimerization subunit type 1 TsaB [Chlamydiota bacterium]